MIKKSNKILFLKNQKLNLNTRLLEISIGVLLGDSTIQKNTSKSVEKYRLKFLQSANHKEYIYHLHSEFKDYVKAQPFFNSERNTYSFQTIFHPDFKQLANIFLDEKGKKVIKPFFFQNIISPI